jgi:hypothetical protein
MQFFETKVITTFSNGSLGSCIDETSLVQVIGPAMSKFKGVELQLA